MRESRWELRVKTPGSEYPVMVGPGCVRELAEFLSAQADVSSVHLITDENVDRHYGSKVFDLLRGIGKPAYRIAVPAGEGSKCPETLARLWSDLARIGCDRASVIVALGGGVVGDLAGFAAATIVRGIRFVQVPTTLLAMVDASVGGKTGIDLPEGKNLVGAFHQPSAVFVDPEFLRTLPEREIRAGWAEAIKTACIRDARLFEWLEQERGPLLRGEGEAVARAVKECVRIKAEVVGADERESGLRRILNFGHTLGHGIEAASRYAGWLHGEAVAVGMCFAVRLGESLGVTSPDVPARVQTLVERFGLPSTAKGHGLSRGRILEAMARDKKKGLAGVRWVLLSKIGSAVVKESVPQELIESLLEEFVEAD